MGALPVWPPIKMVMWPFCRFHSFTENSILTQNGLSKCVRVCMCVCERERVCVCVCARTHACVGLVSF